MLQFQVLQSHMVTKIQYQALTFDLIHFDAELMSVSGFIKSQWI